MPFIAYKNRPDEALYVFSSVGDSVSIGRDKRVCRICVGAKAQAVSRVHLKIELKLVEGSEMLVAHDMSTYGTGYNGGPLVVEKAEKNLKIGDVLQIGSFYFVICEKPKKLFDDDDDFATNISDSAMTEIQSTVGIKQSSSKLSTVKSTIGDTSASRQCIARAGASETDTVENAKKQSETTRAQLSAFLPSDDDEEDSPFTLNLARKRKKMTKVFAEDSDRSENDGEEEQGKHHEENESTVVADSIVQKQPEYCGRKNRLKEICSAQPELDISRRRCTRASQLSSHVAPLAKKKRDSCGNTDTHSDEIVGQDHFDEEHHETGVQEEESEGFRGVEAAHESSAVSESFSKKEPLRGGRQRSSKKRAASSEDRSTLSSWLNSQNGKQGVQEATSVTAGNTTRGEVDSTELQPKRVKLEPIEESENAVDAINKVFAEECVFNPNEVKVEHNDVEENDVEENVDFVLGMDIDTLKRKLEKAVQFENLERKTMHQNWVSVDSNGSSSVPNFKRFRKAAQGSHCRGIGPIQTTKTQIYGMSDLIDYRQF